MLLLVVVDNDTDVVDGPVIVLVGVVVDWAAYHT